jgi:hypothetical protein
LLQYSEEFDDAAWTKTNCTITANDAVSPDGYTNADKLVESSDVSAQTHQIRSSTTTIVTNQVYTYSIFAKSSGRGIQMRASRSDGSTFSTVNVDYDLTLGVVDSFFENNAEYVGSSIEDYGNGWYRCILQMRFTDPTNISQRMQVYTYNESTNSVNYIGNGTSGVFIWGAQLETGSTATEYIPTTNSARTTFAGITQDGTSASNVPRLDYSQGSCPSLLLEPQRTNTILRSQDLSNASWTKTNVTITQNAITSPIESFNSDAIVENSGTNTVFGFHAASRPSGLTIGTTYSVSFFAKKITRDWCYFDDFNAFQTPRVLVFFNLANGTVGTSQIGVLNPKMENYGNGWYRCSFQFVASSTLIDYRIASATSDNTVSYSGTIGQESISVTACQFEAGSYATSYIPTTSATVTRLADACFKYSISSLIGQTEGVLFFEFDYKKAEINTALFNTSLNNNDNIYLLALSNFNLRMYVTVGGVFQVAITTSTIPSEGRHKVALAYKENDCAFYLDGVQVGVDTSCTIPTVDDLLLKTPNQNTRQVLIFKTRLSNTQLSELTTL